MARLLIKSSGPQAQAIDLKLGPNRLGRSPDSDFQIDHPTVSGRHCEIVLGGKSIIVRDLGSTNGTFINGEPIKEAELHAGQMLRLGTVEIELESEQVEISIPPQEVSQGPSPSFMPDGHPACLNHPGLAATHFCIHCSQCFCDACVHEIHRVGGIPLKLCPVCGGRCEPLGEVTARGKPAKKKKSLLGLWHETLKITTRRFRK